MLHWVKTLAWNLSKNLVNHNILSVHIRINLTNHRRWRCITPIASKDILNVFQTLSCTADLKSAAHLGRANEKFSPKRKKRHTVKREMHAVSLKTKLKSMSACVLLVNWKKITLHDNSSLSLDISPQFRKQKLGSNFSSVYARNVKKVITALRVNFSIYLLASS